MATEFLFITGMSGAGKSVVGSTLDDNGYYCIDNMPAALLSKFAELYTLIPNQNPKVAFIIDVRGENEFTTFQSEIDVLKAQGYLCRTIFIDCETDVIINRYKENRRIHPLAASRSLPLSAAIEEERHLLEPVRDRADFIINTTQTSNAQLRDSIKNILSSTFRSGPVISCISFGFKYGLPQESDLVFDVRCFPNPFYVPELRDKTGLDPEVSGFMLSNDQANEFLCKLYDMMSFLIPLYIGEGKMHLIIAVGCTGGKHRSVTFAECLRKYLSGQGYNAVIEHRDINKN